MSGILKRIVQHKKLLLSGGLLLAIEILIGCFCQNRSVWEIILVIDLIGIILLLFDIKAVLLIKEQMNPFDAYSRTRNVDYLIIGEPCHPVSVLPDNNSTYVQIKVPGASEFAIYQILRRTFSILNDQGTVIFVVKKSNVDSKRIRVFDTFFLHEMTVQEMKLSRLSKLKKFVLMINPSACLKLISGVSLYDFTECKYYNSGGVERKFCLERELSFRIFTG